MADGYKIVIREDEGGGFRVAPVPAIPDRPDLSTLRPSHKEARRFADSLKVVKGWPVVDLTDESVNGCSG